MEFVLVLLIGFAAGAWLSLHLAGVRELRLRGAVLEEELSSARASEAALRARFEAEQLRSAEKLALLTAAEQKLANTFALLSSDSLRANNEAFLQLANQTLSRFHETARSELDGRQKAIGESLQPVKEYLDRVDSKIGELEKARVAAYSSLAEQVKSLAITQVDLQKETANLVKALRTPHTRGRWGEVQLRRVVEMAGMLERCDFHEQHTIHAEGGRLRPDLIVRLPNGRSIVVDSKAPLSAYLESIESIDDATRIARLKDHAAQVRTHVRALSQKGYWSQLDSTPEFAVAFLPGEPFFSAALEHDPELIEYGVELGVVIATPTTLVALLKAVAYGWRQQEMARNAHEISKLGAEIYDRLSKFASTFAKVGSNLEKAVDSYNASVGTLETRILPSARRIKEKGATGAVDIAETPCIDKTPRPLHAAELIEGPQQSPLT